MKKTCVHVAVFWIVIGGVVACAPEKSVRLQDGRALEEQGDYLGAFAYYQKMPYPGFREECLRNLRYLYGGILDALLEQRDHPNAPEANYQVGKAYYEKAQAIPAYPEIVPNAGLDTAAYFAAQQAMFYTQAQKALASATSLVEQQATSSIQGQKAPAAAPLPKSYQAALLLEGNLYVERNEPEKAASIYQQLVDLRTEAPQAYYQLSVLLYERGQTQEGLALAKRAAAAYPDNPDAHLVLGLLFAREGEHEQAIAEFQQTLCGDPLRSGAYYRIAQLYLQQHNLFDAERVLRLGYLNNPTSRKLALFYSALQAILDAKEEAEAQIVYQQFAQETGTTQPSTPAAFQSKAISPALQRLNLGLRLKILKRQQPYALPCAGAAENAYFTKEINRIQEKIDALTQLSQSAQPSPPAVK